MNMSIPVRVSTILEAVSEKAVASSQDEQLVETTYRGKVLAHPTNHLLQVVVKLCKNAVELPRRGVRDIDSTN